MVVSDFDELIVFVQRSTRLENWTQVSWACLSKLSLLLGDKLYYYIDSSWHGMCNAYTYFICNILLYLFFFFVVDVISFLMLVLAPQLKYNTKVMCLHISFIIPSFLVLLGNMVGVIAYNRLCSRWPDFSDVYSHS